MPTFFTLGGMSGRSNPVTKLCARSDNTEFWVCSEDTVPVGGNVFAYAAYSDGRHTGPADSPDVQAQGSSCRSISLRYALESFSNHSASTTGVALSQATADQQQASGPYGVINSATFSIKSPVWNLTFRNDGGQGEGTYFNGTVSCWSSTGDR